MKALYSIIVVIFFFKVLNGFFLDRFYNDGFSIKINNKLNEGGFSNVISVYTSEPLKERSCIIHYANSDVYVNYDVKMGGRNTASLIHTALGTMETFQIGDFEGALVVKKDEDYIESFGVDDVSCIIGLGSGNVIFKDFRITPRVIYDHESNDGTAIQCNILTDELCSFNVDISYNDTIIASGVKIVFTSTFPYTLIPQDIFNSIYLDQQLSQGKQWMNINFCTSADPTTCFYISKDNVVFNIHETSTNTIGSYNGTDILIGTSALQSWDIAYSNYTVKIKQRAVIISVSSSFQMMNIFTSFVISYILLTRPVTKFKTPNVRNLFDTVKMILQGIYLIVPNFIFLYQQFYDNLILETGNYAYFLISYQLFITCTGLLAFMFSSIYECFHYAFIFIPIISIYNLIFYFSIFDFTEGNSTWNQIIIFQIITVNLYTFTLFNFFQRYSKPKPICQIVIVVVFALLATFFNVWSGTLILIPSLQRLLRLFNWYIIVFYFFFTFAYLILACVMFIGLTAMFFKIEFIRVKSKLE